MSILIIGGTGFIGRRLVPLLAKRGEEIVCMDMNPQTADYSEFGKKVRVVRGDVSQFDDVMAAMANAKASRVINLAYFLGSELMPRLAFKLNKSRQASRLRSGARNRKAGWNIGKVGTGMARPGTARSNQRPRSRVIPSLTGKSALAAVPPHSTRTCGAASAIWRSTKGRQAAISALVGLRLPGGRQ